MARPSRASAPSTRIIGFRLTEEEERRLDELVGQFGHKDRSVLLRSWLAQKPEANAFAFTEDEERRLDELVAEQKHEDRTALIRSWLNERKPVPQAILARCTPLTQKLFSFVLDEATRREYKINWYSLGFWVTPPNRTWSMACCERDDLSVDFREVGESIRHNELATGLWDWFGTDGIHLQINESNVEHVRERIVRIFETGMVTVPKSEPKDSTLEMRDVYKALRRNQDARIGLMYVPDVVRAVAHLVPIDRVHAVLRVLVERGVLELRPDAGGEHRPKEDVALCPPGPRKTVFAYAKWKGGDAAR
jgi:hypothetical protein